MAPDKETLIKQATEWAQKYLDSNFEFRKYQLESIVLIITRVLDEVKTQVMNAPTGSGKSLTAIISAGVLFEYYKKTSYILCSDLSLFAQYEADLKRYNLPWGHLKGKDNYVCQRNGNIVSCGECALNMVSTRTLQDAESAEKAGYSCAKECEYVKMRNLAMKAPVTVMTYQLYLIQRNYVNDLMGGEDGYMPFPERDFVICDEAHKLNDIIQSHYAPRIPVDVPEFMKTLDKYASKHHIKVPDSRSTIRWANKLKSAKNHADIISAMQRYSDLLSEYAYINEKVREEAQKTRQFRKLRAELTAGNLARECNCKCGDFLELVKELGPQIAVKTEGENEITINCTYEGEMITKYFHNVSKCELFMSATLGDLTLYKELIGVKDCPKGQYKGLDVPSTFDFSKSPIYYSEANPMSFKEKANSIRPICRQIIEICNMFKGKRGIIQTGNYENTTKLLDYVPADLKKRFITYTNAREKNYALDRFLESDDGILVGPTLLEGLNFDGDKCRFSICMKLPYASLANNLVAAKKDLIPNWYAGQCVASLEQGFGRGVRFNGDWCVNYILDGCIASLIKYNANLFSRNTQMRFKRLG